MKKSNQLFFLVLLLSTWCFSSNAAISNDLYITEIMQSNIDCTMDDIHEFPDSWVELYNPTDEIIYLKGYKLGDKKKPEKAYELPGQYPVYPHSHFLIYCDKGGFNRHATFRLESTSKGSLYLFHNDEIIDKVEDYPAQPSPNISYGRETDISDIWGWQITPTPESSNRGGISDVILGEPEFSEPGRIGSQAVILELSVPAGSPDGTVIKYTIDGSEPTVKSNDYEQPLEISDNCVVRAKLFCDGTISIRSTTHSYIFHPQEMTLPIISVVTDNDFLYGDKIGIFSDSINVSGRPNYEYDWRRPVNFEYFDKEDSGARLNQLSETRLKGNVTRTYLIKSIVFYANKRFGAKRFKYEFFPDQKPGFTDFKSIEARNAGNDCYRTYLRDALIQRMMGENADLDWQAWQPAVVYINGEYYGILNIRERSNEDNVYTNHDGLEDIDLIENWRTLSEGDLENFSDFKAFYYQPGHTYEEYEKRMDIREFINYFILQMFYFNYDFPGNNVIMWRPKDEAGKWRWICKDLDYGLGCVKPDGWDLDFLDWLYYPEKEKYAQMNWANSEEYNMLFRRLLEIPEFRKQLIDTFTVYLGDFLTDEKTIEKLDYMSEQLMSEWPRHYEKNNKKWNSYDFFKNQIIEYVTNRYGVIHGHLANWFDLGTPIELNITDSLQLVSGIEVQDIKLVNGQFKGKYYIGRDLKISAESVSDEFKGWIVESTLTDGIINKEFLPKKDFDLLMPDAVTVNIYPVSDKTLDTGIDDIEKDEDVGIAEYYNLNGVKINGNNPIPGVYIRKKQNGTVEKVLIR